MSVQGRLRTFPPRVERCLNVGKIAGGGGRILEIHDEILLEATNARSGPINESVPVMGASTTMTKSSSSWML